MMQRLFGIGGAEGIYFPNVWPMGFHSSPEVAQVISWLTILARRETEDGLGVRSEELQQMPRFLKIYNTQGDVVGYIFVLLDNILVVSCSKNVTQQWSHRILRNISDFNLEVKAEEIKVPKAPIFRILRCLWLFTNWTSQLQSLRMLTGTLPVEQTCSGDPIFFFFLPGTLLRGECFGRATERNRGSGTAADQAMGQRKVGKMESISSEGLETAQTRVHVSARVLLLIQVKNPLSFFVSDETHGAG